MIKQKTVLITGASKGIGKETAKLFARSGYNVLINYNHSEIDANNLYHTLREQGFNIDIFKANVAIRLEVDAMINYCVERFGTIDVLVNNAGISKIAAFADLTEYEWDETIAVNLKGVFNCSQAVLVHMLKQKSGQIINLSSIWGITGGSCEVHYSAAKAGVIGLTKALAKELGPSGIRVNCVAPGIIETDMNTGLDAKECEILFENTPLKRFRTALEVAQCILFLSSEEASFITGQVLSPNGGFVV